MPPERPLWWEVGDWRGEIQYWLLAHPVAYSGFPNLICVQAAILQGNPSLRHWRLTFLKHFFPQTKRCFRDAGDWGQQQGWSVGTLAKAHPEPSHLRRPASGWLRTGHRTARRYRSTGCGRTTPAAGMERRRSGHVRLEERPTGGIHSRPPRIRQTKPPWPSWPHRRPSPWCRRRPPRSLWRPISRCGESVEPIGQLHLGFRKCLRRCLVARWAKPRKLAGLGKGGLGR